KRKLKKLKKLKYVIIDGTERPIRRPTDKDLQKEFYFGKKRHTIKI
ncbi:transposase family protein, partial [Leptospira interrogans]